MYVKVNEAPVSVIADQCYINSGKETAHTAINSFAFSDAITLRTRSTAAAEEEFWNLSKIVAAVKSKAQTSSIKIFSLHKRGHTSKSLFILSELF